MPFGLNPSLSAAASPPTRIALIERPVSERDQNSAVWTAENRNRDRRPESRDAIAPMMRSATLLTPVVDFNFGLTSYAYFSLLVMTRSLGEFPAAGIHARFGERPF